MYKFILALGFTFRSILSLKIAFCVLCCLCLIFKIYLRVRRTLIFNSLVLLSSLLIDTLLIHYLFFLMPAELFKENSYWIYITLLLPCTFLFVWFLYTHFGKNWVIRNFEQPLSVKEELFVCLVMYDIYCNQTSHKQLLPKMAYTH